MATQESSAAAVSLLSTDYRTLNYVTGPLIFVNDVHGVAYNEMVAIRMPDGSRRSGQVLEVSGTTAVIQVFEGTQGIDIAATEVRFLEEVAKIDVTAELLGRVLNGTGKPIDGGAPVIPETRLTITGDPINPYSREQPWIVVPGVRLPGDASHDQACTVTPEVAVQRGATHLVVGRSITQAADPQAAFGRITAAVG
jgi:flagellar biosynthesis/type III secretory pathway ATPase